MILLFTGAGCTGKTTMAKAAAERYGVPFLKSNSREVQQDFGLKCEDDQLALTPGELSRLQKLITDRYWSDACAEKTFAGQYVADRTIACHFTYRAMKGWAGITHEELAQYERRILEQFTSADLVVHCPTGLFEAKSGGFRTDDKVQRDIFDRFIRGTIDRVRDKINVMSMTVADPEARIQHLHSALLNVGAIEPVDHKEARLVRH